MLLYLSYTIAWWGIRIFPRPFCVWFSKRVADICFVFDTAARRAVIANLAHVLSHTGRETQSRRGRRGIDRLARETFENFAVHIMDFLRVYRVRDDIESGLLRIEHFDRFAKEFARGRGLISVTAHVGNWEMGAAATAGMGLPLSAVTLKLPDGRIDRFFTKLRESGHIRPFPSGRAALGCFKVLAGKEMLAFVADRDIDGNGLRVKFFGEEVSIPRGPAEMAARTGAPIVPAFCVQEAGGHFRLVVEKPIDVDERLPVQEKVEAITRAMVRVFEEYISRYPAQWFAFYKVWG
ncbi:MAG: lysophospholipid acyltransferase family protein [Chlamydiota bacterium]